MRTFVLVIITIFLFVSPSNAQKRTKLKIYPNNFEVIKSTVIYSVDWTIMPNRSVSPKDMIVNLPQHIYIKSDVNDKMMRRELNELIEDLVPYKENRNLDVRVVCLLFKVDRVDTLSFGNFEYCELNGKLYTVVTGKGKNILEFIMDYLPYNQTKFILELKKLWLKYKEEEEEKKQKE